MNEVIVVGLIAIGAAILVIKVSTLEGRPDRLSRLEANVDALLKHAGVRFDQYQDVPADVREALDRGETILAIKRFRAATGAGLKEAKEFVDEVRRRKTAAS